MSAVANQTVVASIHNQTLTISGNTAGASTWTGTNLVYQGGANLTVSLTSNSLIFSGAGSGLSGVVAISASDTAYTSGTVVFTGSNAVTVRSTTGQAVVIDAPVQTVQSVGWYASGNTTSSASSTTLDARSLTIRGAGIISIGYSAGEIIISA